MNFVCESAVEMSAELYQSVSRYRRKVFVDRLGWDLPSGMADCEQDQFDRAETVYLAAQNPDGEVIGCGRLLPSTGSYLLQTVFPDLLNGVPAPQSADVWELSRFAAGDPASATAARREHLAERLLLRALQFCERRGARQLLAVTTVAVERLMLRAGVELQRLGPPRIIDGQPVLALVIEVSERSLLSLSAFEEAFIPTGAPIALSPSWSAARELSAV
jgi:acyl homoserine lactone synthase